MLDFSVLRSSFSAMLNSQSYPNSLESAVNSFCEAYQKYAVGGIVGAIPQTIPFSVRSVISGGFFESLDLSIESSWRQVVWSGPGVFANVSVIPIRLSSLFHSTSSRMNQVVDRSSAAQIIAENFHTYTVGIVTMVNSPPSTPYPLNII